MATTAKLLFPSADLANAAALLYTSPANGHGTWVDKATAVNHGGGTYQLTVYHVPSGGAAGTSNLKIDAKSLSDKATYLCPELVGMFIPAGAMLYGFADTAAKIAFEVSGREIT